MVGTSLSHQTRFITAFLLFLFSPVFADNQEEDRARASKVEDMYDGYRRSFPVVRDISAGEAMKRFEEGTVIFVDEREPEEQAVSMLPGAIKAEEFLKDPARYQDKLVVGYCTISYRSGVLAQELQKRGITMVNLKGGILAWIHAGGKVYRGGSPVNEVHVYGRKWNLAPSSYRTVW